MKDFDNVDIDRDCSNNESVLESNNESGKCDKRMLINLILS